MSHEWTQLGVQQSQSFFESLNNDCFSKSRSIQKASPKRAKRIDGRTFDRRTGERKESCGVLGRFGECDWLT